MPENDTLVSIRMPASLVAELDVRHAREASTEGTRYGRGSAARTCLERYLALMRREARALRELLTPEEALAVADSMNGWASRMEPAEMLTGEILAGTERYTVLAMHVQDSIALEGLAEMHEIDGPALVAKLQRLTRSQTLALIDAVERWWSDPERDGRAIL